MRAALLFVRTLSTRTLRTRTLSTRMLRTRTLRTRTLSTFVLSALALTTESLRAQSAAAPPSVTRADLATAYLRLDRAYTTASMPDSLRATINKTFDRATLSFFAGKFAAAVAAVDSATVLLTGKPLEAPPAPPARVVNGRMPSVLRGTLLARLARLDSAGPLAQAIVSARARVQLLVDTASRERSIEFLTDPAALARDLVREVSVLERGRDPYVGQAGDAWRMFRGHKGTLIPMRVIAPAAAAVSSAPVPVVIALHGAGGDENMFADSYGAGLLPQMAIAANAIVVTPATTPFSAAPENFDSLMTVLRAEYRINGARIYVIGHSMGAGAAARLAQQRPEQLAAVACLSGGSAVTVAKAPPILFLGAALDPVIPARVVQAAAKGTPTGTYEQLEHEGHTLMVANGIRRALPWLLSHRP
ncbi:MAG: PHB depolymerase family esterase [Gemmatimonadaceae bacterium]